MKKIFILLVMFSCLFLVGCGTQKEEEESFVAIGKVNIVAGCEESCPLSLKLITNKNIEDVSVVTTDATTDYEYTVSKMKTVGLSDKGLTAQSYKIDFTFTEPTVMTKVSLQLDDEIVDFDIGSFQCVSLDNTLTTFTKGTDPHLDVTQYTNLEQGYSYIQPTQVKLFFENLTEQNLIINNVELVSSSEDIDVSVIKSIQPRSFLRPEETNEFAYVYFNSTDESTMHASAIVKIDYTYLGEDFCKYVLAECGYTNEILESELMGGTIATTALVEGVVRAGTTE